MPKTIQQTLYIQGMTCINCQNRIQKQLQKLTGVVSATVSYQKSEAQITYNAIQIDLDDITKSIEKMGYSILDKKQAQGSYAAVGAVVVILGLFLLLRYTGLASLANAFPQAQEGMGYGLLLVIGFLTSFHCIAMCGGINLSQCVASPGGEMAGPGWRPSALYNLGRIISYTVIGGIVGALGSAVSLSGKVGGAVQLIAGLCMILMGLNMLGLAPWLRKLRLTLPRISALERVKEQGRGPLVVGLINGLMPCGPLQAMQMYALSTGSAAGGALAMFLFSLGTVPLMFGLGALSTVLSGKFTRRLATGGAALVVVLGVAMTQRGFALTGMGLGAPGAAQGAVAADMVSGQEEIQVVRTAMTYRGYPAITVKAGIPVQWILTAEQGTLNGCNYELIIPEYGIQKQLEVGDNLIEFTPTKSGRFPYSCWMGMIRSSITVENADGTVEEDQESGGESPGEQWAFAPSDYQIPTDDIAVAQIVGGVQQVEIAMDNGRFSPAVVVMQYGVETQWVIHNESSIDALLFPIYGAKMELVDGENLVYLLPLEDFAFQDEDNAFFGMVKVVESVDDVDLEELRREVSAYRPMAVTAP